MTKTIADYIDQLLFTNDCVIIPEFGGFVSSYKHAEVHPIKHHFQPPSKRIAFNEKLKLNDGLLISAIAQGEKISLSDATQQVEKFVAQMAAKLREKEEVVVDRIGKVFKNAEGRLQFKAEVKENHLDDSFGLPDFFSNPILRDQQHNKLRNKYKDRKAMSTDEIKEEKQAQQNVKKKSNASIWVLSSLVVVLLASAVYLLVIDKSENNMLSSILPASWFQKNTDEQPADTTETEEFIAEDSTMMEGEEVFAEEENTYTEETAVEESNTSGSSTSSGETFLTSLTGRYYVIAGAFSEQANAETLRDELIGKGYDAKVLSPLGQKPLFRVSIADFDSQEEGLSKANTDNATFGNALWVMKY